MELDQLKCLQNVMQNLDAKTSNKNKYDHFQVPESDLAKFINTKITGMKYTDNILNLLQRGNIVSIKNKPNSIEDLKINNINLKKALLLINGDIYTAFMNHKSEKIPNISNEDFRHVFDPEQMTDLFIRDQTLRIIYGLLILSERNGGDMIFVDYKPSDYWDLFLEINTVFKNTFTPPTDDQLMSVDSDHIQLAMSKLTKLGIINQIAGIITLNRYRLYVYLVNIKNILVLNKK